MQHMHRAALAFAGALTIAIAAGCSSSNPTATTPITLRTPLPTATPTVASPMTWKAQAGASMDDEAFQALRFYPSSITIDAGDSVQWIFAALEPHTVSFPVTGASPVPASDPSVSTPEGGTTVDGTSYVSSGFLAGGATYTLTFPKPGTYTYYSLIHQPEAVGTIVVQAAGTAYPAMQSAYDSAGAAELADDYASDETALSEFPYTAGGPHVSAGIASGLAAAMPANASVMRFLSSTSAMSSAITVAVGTTVTWTNESNNVPHDVVFPVAGGSVPSTLGPFDPASGPSSYDGSTLTDSGVIPPGGSYSLTFSKAGTYTYTCLFHDDEHMQGTVTVQ